MLIVIVMLCLSISPTLMEDTNAFENTNQLAIDHPVDEGVGMKNTLSQQKLLPPPAFVFLFLILPLGTIVRMRRWSLFCYPSVFLLRLKLLLQPIQFTSIFLIRSFA